MVTSEGQVLFSGECYASGCCLLLMAEAWPEVCEVVHADVSPESQS